MVTRFFVFITALFCFKVNAQEKWTLQQCVDYALVNNVSVKQADIQSRISRLTSNQSLANRYPTISGGINSAYQHGLNENPTTGTLQSSSFIGGDATLQATYNIFNWGARRNTIIANNLYAKADQIGIDKAKNDVALVVANAFLQVMLRREQARISEIQMGQSRSQLNFTRKLVKAGSQPELNAIQIETQYSKDSSSMLQARALAEQAMINLKGTMNYDFALPFDIASPVVESIKIDNISDLQPEVVYNKALNTQPVQKMYKLRLEANQSEIRAARGLMYPSLIAFGNLNTRAVNAKRPVFGYSFDTTAAFVAIGTNQYKVFAPSANVIGMEGIPFFSQLKNNFGQNVGLSLNFSIFNAYATRTQWERAKVTQVQLQAQNEQENLTLRTNIYNAYQDAISSFQRYNASKRTVQYSQRAVDMAKKRFDIGLLGTLDFIITQNNLYLAQIDEVSNHYDYVFKMKVLEFYKGQGIKL
jgi:outer membrane protein